MVIHSISLAHTRTMNKYGDIWKIEGLLGKGRYFLLPLGGIENVQLIKRAMSQMLADIKRIVNEDVSIRITQYEVLYEAITNAIHANATKITCLLESFDNVVGANDSNVFFPYKVDNMTIIDNGDGLNPTNYASFCKYRTEHKKELGCKGVGRFIFLKVYKSVHYKSSLAKEQEVRSFTFNFDFDTDNIKIVPVDQNDPPINTNKTEISFEGVTLAYQEASKSVDRRIDLELDVIRENVLIHLIPTLYFYKKKRVGIDIELKDTKTGQTVSITSADVPDFSDKKFTIRDKDGMQKDFSLHYQIKEGNGRVYAYYCSNSRTVCEFSDKDFKITLPNDFSGFLLLEGEYLNAHVNNERNDFDIFPVRTDVYSTISWEMINAELKQQVAALVKDLVPEAMAINKQKLEEIQEERPYLVEYIEDQDIDMAGFLDKRHIIEKAKKKFDVAKEKLLAGAGKDVYTEKELADAIQIAQNELVAYICDRVQVIDRLKALVNKKERVESIIHNLFMKQYTDDDYFSVGKNNLWLLDDRFTSYSYAASDRRIKEVLAELGEESDDIDNAGDKPDLSLFFSHNPINPKSLKSVLVEIKPFDFSKKPDRKKHQGIQQLVDYVKAFKKKENIEEIWAYLITDIDDKLAERLRNDDYTPLFSTIAPIFHRFFKDLGISIYVIDAKTLISDAESRNRVFLDIIRKKSKLNDLLSPAGE